MRLIGRTLPALGALGCLLLVSLVWSDRAAAERYYHADAENCMMCHKYPGLARVDENHELRLLFINERLLEQGPHYRVQCGDCHGDIDMVPHMLPVEEVNCLKQCHIVEPSTGERFTHERIQNFMTQGAHSRYDQDGNLKQYADDMPGCIDCHWEEPMYQPMTYFKGDVYEGLDEQAMERCVSCHEGEGFTESFYKHVSSRLEHTRSAGVIEQMCANCHDNPELIERHDLKRAVYSYKYTFHAKWTAFGGRAQPDCTDCHSNRGESVHLIRSQDDPLSAIHPDNRQATCSQIGCHENAGPYVGDIGVHIDTNLPEYVVERYVYYMFIVLLAGVLIGVYVLMILEQIRGLFPDAGLIKERDKHHDK
ncbi:hypothetical protein [Desulfurivibrio dismutans]|uniref:hypothetical protein n=1 Tax=Desulfurivibrio dismutans TaxID=1398908 RepID=UPI0023DB45E6|nr:hypothetical protein [Desulfurivibrio alkaliphilus]MDF1613887.1 hypothetical protein [Desulfurivibrio alkaliphilus]